MKLIGRSGPVRGAIAAPSSKSYTIRALLLASATEGTTTVLDPLDSDDTRYTLDAIRKIGFEVSGSFRDGIQVGERTSMSAGEVDLYVGNSGAAIRFLTGYLAFTPGRFLLRGDARLHERPIGALVDALQLLGTEVEYAGAEGYPPIVIRGRRMRGGGEVTVDGSLSSQFVSALMLGAASVRGGLQIRVDQLSSAPYVRITADILRAFGATVEQDTRHVRVVAPAALRRDSYVVEGDYSSASYWFAAAAVTGGSVTVSRLRGDSEQGDRQFLGVLEQLGCSVRVENEQVTVSADAPMTGGRFDMNAMPDVVPTLAAIAPAARAPIEITNVGTLRLKESDRLAALAEELARLGGIVEERESSIRISPGWRHADRMTVDPHGDHRIAMSFAIAGLERGNVAIENEQVVAKSYPRFWKTLEEVATLKQDD